MRRNTTAIEILQMQMLVSRNVGHCYHRSGRLDHREPLRLATPAIGTSVPLSGQIVEQCFAFSALLLPGSRLPPSFPCINTCLPVWSLQAVAFSSSVPPLNDSRRVVGRQGSVPHTKPCLLDVSARSTRTVDSVTAAPRTQGISCTMHACLCAIYARTYDTVHGRGCCGWG